MAEAMTQTMPRKGADEGGTAPEPVAIRVGGVEIPPSAIAAEAQNHPAPDAHSAYAAASEALAVKQLLLAEAERLDIAAPDITDEDGRALVDDDARIEALLAQEITVPQASDEEAERFYDRHQARFMSETLIEAEHILLSASPDDTLVYNMALSDARGLIHQLEAQPDHFAALAREYSACPSREQGGNLGQIGKGQTVPEFEEALFALGEGELCAAPVKTQYGVHVIRAGRRAEGQRIPFAEVSAMIKTYIEEASYRRAIAQYLSILASKTTIEGIDLAIAEGPLVQ